MIYSVYQNHSISEKDTGNERTRTHEDWPLCTATSSPICGEVSTLDVSHHLSHSTSTTHLPTFRTNPPTLPQDDSYALELERTRQRTCIGNKCAANDTATTSRVSVDSSSSNKHVLTFRIEASVCRDDGEGEGGFVAGGMGTG